MEADPQKLRLLTSTADQIRCLAPGSSKLSFKRNFAVRRGTCHANDECQILRVASRGCDLLQLCFRVERKGSHAKVAVGFRNKAPGFHGMHDMHRRARKLRHRSHFLDGSHVEMTNTGA